MQACFEYAENALAVDFSNAPLTGAQWKPFFAMLPELGSAMIRGFAWDRNLMHLKIIDIITNCPRLKAFSHRTVLNQTDFFAFLLLLRKLVWLKKCGLARNTIEDEFLPAILEAVVDSAIEELDVSVFAANNAKVVS
jgi:hypothetical protein